MKFAVGALLVCSLVATLVNSQTPTSPSTSNVSNTLDSLLYESGGLGAVLDAETRIDWAEVQTFLAPNFHWEDYSTFPSFGNYTSYQEYWRALNRNNQTFPLIEAATLQWRSCDPVNRRQISQWQEPYALANDTSVRENSTSLYIVEFANDSLAITRQAYWTSGNLVNLTLRAV